MDEWCLIESDPAVFWDITKRLEVEDIQYEEILHLAPESFRELEIEYGTVHGLIFLFRWHPGLKSVRIGEQLPYVPSDMFFAKQVIQNSCASQAMLSILLNKCVDKQLGPILKEFKEFTAQFNPELCGITLANHETLRAAHNSFKPSNFLQFSKERNKAHESKDDPFHYIAIFPKNKKVWLLDGLNEHPVVLGEYLEVQAEPEHITTTNSSNWWMLALKGIEEYISRLQSLPGDNNKYGNEIRFNLIAVVPDRLRNTLERLAITPHGSAEANMLHQVEQLENAKRKNWIEENSFRRFDLIPFLLCCLRHLAKEKKLVATYHQQLN
eukprot:Gregarina_sp_Poly_1__1061@NODE_125_length_13444_cov_91_472378_g111_i0_p5_GENE_NODE_125_length_13444_cov_91_472378_g111_i0NODE_125_length_13444_cov_91_472378_g111_i0_p5_ORF_typecomplete_len325_score40_33Peptidase_C12/PF01088_21/7_3e47Peptidase_C12/PF01088_21/5_6e03UCH_C/PF18031_1/1_1e08_NODE_125_length_13444_cov_91_472378_g111_i01224113215